MKFLDNLKDLLPGKIYDFWEHDKKTIAGSAKFIIPHTPLQEVFRAKGYIQNLFRRVLLPRKGIGVGPAVFHY